MTAHRTLGGEFSTDKIENTRYLLFYCLFLTILHSVNISNEDICWYLLAVQARSRWTSRLKPTMLNTTQVRFPPRSLCWEEASPSAWQLNWRKRSTPTVTRWAWVHRQVCAPSIYYEHILLQNRFIDKTLLPLYDAQLHLCSVRLRYNNKRNLARRNRWNRKIWHITATLPENRSTLMELYWVSCTKMKWLPGLLHNGHVPSLGWITAEPEVHLEVSYQAGDQDRFILCYGCQWNRIIFSSTIYNIISS